MKSLKKSLVLLLVFCLLLGLASCGEAILKNEPILLPSTDSPTGIPDWVGDADYRSESASYGKGSGGEYPVSDTGDSVEPSEESSKIPQYNRPAGLITAAAWNENLHYDFWKSLFTSGQSEEEDGKFVNFYQNNRWGFDSTQRVTVTVKQGENPVSGATVTCLDASGKECFVAKTGADGIAYLFPEAGEGTIKVKSGDFSAEAPFTAATRDVEVQLDGAEAKKNTIKIMLVIDVTGSMGDELNYLQTELVDVINRIADANSGVQIELALLFYRDDGDAEKFAYNDFVNVNTPQGLSTQLIHLRAQRADGGGDYPEAVDEALELAMSKAWGDDNSTKIIFHLLDAPPHSNDQYSKNNYEKRFETAVRKAAGMGIRLCPILCSGADSLCEYLMRQEAIYTGGTFIFVTDDSGIGGAHHDPNIPDAVVEKLNDLMVRIVVGYHTGVFADPVPWIAPAQNQTQTSEVEVAPEDYGK